MQRMKWVRESSAQKKKKNKEQIKKLRKGMEEIKN